MRFGVGGDLLQKKFEINLLCAILSLYCFPCKGGEKRQQKFRSFILICYYITMVLLVTYFVLVTYSLLLLIPVFLDHLLFYFLFFFSSFPFLPFLFDLGSPFFSEQVLMIV